MAGHSKWANIKRHKSVVDAKRGQIFTKLIKEITVSARMGGGDVGTNPRLRVAIEKAKAQSMPKDNIERAIKKGTGELEGAAIEEIVYEGYGQGGVAVIVECATDNKNRTASEMRLAFSRNGGNLGELGSVGWMFQKKGVIRIADTLITEDVLFEKALDMGADDITHQDKNFVIYTSFENYTRVLDGLQKAGIAYVDCNLELIASNSITVTDKDQAETLIALVDALEANEDVQNVWANFEVDDSILAQLEA